MGCLSPEGGAGGSRGVHLGGISIGGGILSPSGLLVGSRRASEQFFVSAVSLFILPESPRWLVVNGHLDMALAVIHRVFTRSVLPTGLSPCTPSSIHQKCSANRSAAFYSIELSPEVSCQQACLFVLMDEFLGMCCNSSDVTYTHAHLLCKQPQLRCSEVQSLRPIMQPMQSYNQPMTTVHKP